MPGMHALMPLRLWLWLLVLLGTYQVLNYSTQLLQTLTQLVLENAPLEEIETVAALCHSVGLPVTLAQLDIKGDIPGKMRTVAEAACAEGETIHNMPGGATADEVYAALLVADQYGQRFLHEWE